jgi:hypothetical protein
MPDTALASLIEAISADRMMAELTTLARWQKLSGTPEELEGLHHLRGLLDAAGYRTQLVQHDAYISLPGAARVMVDNTALTAITHSMSQSSPPSGVNGRLVDLQAGAPEDFAGRDLDGCILLIDGIASPDVALRASRAGAVGQIHVSPHEHIHEMCVSPIWGSPSLETIGTLPRTVVTTVSDADGAALRARIAAGENPRVVLHAEVDTGWRKTPILVAEMDAPDPQAPFIMFSGHHDTWYHGVMDNGSANIAMVECARVAATRRAEWRRGLRLCFWSGHSHGRYSGSAWYAETHFDELEARCAVHLNIDSPGGVGATVMTNSGCMAELNPLAEDAIFAVTGAKHAGRRKGRNSDESFWGVGIPSMFGSLSMQPQGGAKMRNALGWWWHTPDDRLDKIDPANQRRDTAILTHVLWRLLADPVLPVDYARYAEDMAAAVAPLAEALAGRFPLDRVTEALEALRAAAAAVTGRPPAEANAAIMRASRILVPLDYVAGDRFGQDPALVQAPRPLLEPLKRLAAAQGDAALVAEVSARRAVNRLVHGLRAATAVLRG